jgi:hypothetical protein
MRVVLPLIALLLTTSANARELAQVQPGLPTVRVIGQSDATAVCRDRIQEVRRELGQPTLDRDATPQDPLLIAAVDKRVGGCSVMVMRNDTSDIRPLPAPAEHRLMPAR